MEDESKAGKDGERKMSDPDIDALFGLIFFGIAFVGMAVMLIMSWIGG